MTIATRLSQRSFKFAHALAFALSLIFVASLGAIAQPLEAQNREPSAKTIVEPILQRFVADYRLDPLAQDITFGIEIDGMRWHVISRPSESGRVVELKDGFGDQEMLYFTASRETLNLIDQGVWTGLTAMGAATSRDITPLDILTTEGYERGPNYDATIRPLIFHFWTRGTPEIVQFSSINSRVVHGAPASALYYDRDFRSAVYFVPPGLGREQAPTLTVPFKRMVLILSGSGEGVMGETDFTMKAGDMVISPPNIPVTFWNASDEEPLSFVWLMWGDGA
ncbi:MAG: cupin domain-containing protein [Pseudomonadota bacterium]